MTSSRSIMIKGTFNLDTLECVEFTKIHSGDPQAQLHVPANGSSGHQIRTPENRTEITGPRAVSCDLWWELQEPKGPKGPFARRSPRRGLRHR